MIYLGSSSKRMQWLFGFMHYNPRGSIYLIEGVCFVNVYFECSVYYALKDVVHPSCCLQNLLRSSFALCHQWDQVLSWKEHKDHVWSCCCPHAASERISILLFGLSMFYWNSNWRVEQGPFPFVYFIYRDQAMSKM